MMNKKLMMIFSVMMMGISCNIDATLAEKKGTHKENTTTTTTTTATQVIPEGLTSVTFYAVNNCGVEVVTVGLTPNATISIDPSASGTLPPAQQYTLSAGGYVYTLIPDYNLPPVATGATPPSTVFYGISSGSTGMSSWNGLSQTTASNVSNLQLVSAPAAA